MRKLPYCVDVDGTYLKTDLLFETFLVVVKRRFTKLFKLPFLLFSGRAKLKHYLAGLALPYLHVDLLPVNKELLNFLKEKKQEKHEIYLVSASDERIVSKLAGQQDIFKEAYGSTETTNLKGSIKARFLQEKFPEGFVYVGDSRADLKVWKKAKQGVVVGVDNCIISKAKKITEIIKIFPKNSFRSNLHAWRKELRLYQCVKNLLIFVPLALVHRLVEIPYLLKTFTGFVLLSTLACSTYILNDLMDLNEDRSHWSKSARPIASGTIWIMDAVFVFLALAIISMVLSFNLNFAFGLGVLIYFITTISYSLFLKKIALIDITVLAFLFTIRIALGAFIIDIDNSVWLLSFAFFFFLSLAIAKRVTELQRSNDKANKNVFGRGYTHQDLVFLSGVGIAASVGAVILMLLYLIDQQYLGKGYFFPKLLWGIPVCVFLCAAKIWLEALRGNMLDDPIVFAFTDRFCLTVIAIAAVVFLLAGVGL